MLETGCYTANMFLDMIRAHIPRSWQAGIALVVMVMALGMTFNALGQVLTGADYASWSRLVSGLIVGLPAAVYFYYVQSKDRRPKSADQIAIETLAALGSNSVPKQQQNLPFNNLNPGQKETKRREQG